MYLPYTEIGQQLADQFEKKDFSSQHRAKNSSFEINQQLADQLEKDIFSIPWGHHMLLIDKFLTVPQKALFYVRQTVANGWSRNVLHNFIDSSLYERQGKALSNFNRTIPFADWREREFYRLALLQFEFVMLYSFGSQDRILHLC